MWIRPKASFTLRKISLSVSLLVYVNEPVRAHYGWELLTMLRLHLNLQLQPPSTKEEGYCHINYVVHSPRLLFLLTPCSKHTLDCSFCDYISFCLFFVSNAFKGQKWYVLHLLHFSFITSFYIISSCFPFFFLFIHPSLSPCSSCLL